MQIVDDEILKMYIEESREHLADIEKDLLTIEEQGEVIDEQLVNKVFRAAHSIKGGAGFLDLTRIQELSHKTENVLSMVRSREMKPTPEVINILLLAFDRLREMINNYQTSNETDISEIATSLTGLATSHLPGDEKQSLKHEVEIRVPGVSTVLMVPEFDLAQAKKAINYIYLVEFDLLHDVERLGKTPLQVFKEIMTCGTMLESRIDLDSLGTLDNALTGKIPYYMLFSTVVDPSIINSLLNVDPERIHLVYDAEQQKMIHETQGAPARAVAPPPAPAAAPAPVAEIITSLSETVVAATENCLKRQDAGSVPAQPQAAEKPVKRQDAGSSIEASLRVSVDILESLMNLAGELVLSRNQLMAAIAQGDQHAIQASGQSINMVTSELQEAIMMTRMQPIGNIFNKFPRVVRDLARELGKDVRLDVSGREVEMDKTIVEGLNDPLTHMVRNAVDHGIENLERRRQAGKDTQGMVELKAYHEAGQVIIEVSDDGNGLDPKKIAASAVSKGLVTPEQVRLMSEKEMMALIFLPGLSTAEKVSDVSGRGVGMDVVKTNLDKLGGKVEIESQIGRGTTFRIKLPLTLAIIPSLLVSVEDEQFAIPQINVDELIRIPAAQIKNRIEIVGDAEVLVLRGKLIPLVHLADVLGIQKMYVDPLDGEAKPDRRGKAADRRSRKQDVFESSTGENSAGPESDKRRDSDRRYRAESALNIMIVTAGAFQYGLIVDQLHDSIEIVVKPLGRHLKQAREYAGATIMGDGRVALILDVAGLAGLAGLNSLAGSTRARELKEQARSDKNQGDAHALLLFRNGPNEQCAVPLDLVSRVEQVKTAEIENVGGKRVMQYREQSLPLFTLGDVAGVGALEQHPEMLVIVFQIYGREVGLLANMPVDVIENSGTIDHATLRQRGVIGSTIINHRTTLVIDIFEMVETLFPEWVAARQASKKTGAKGQGYILLAEDSDFFRNRVGKIVEEAGYTVQLAEDGLQAWEMLQADGGKIQLVLTDIEMPNLDGLGLTRKIRQDMRFKHLPVLALTSLAGEEDVMRGKAVGVTDYMIKLDKEKLVEAIHGTMSRLVPLELAE